MCGRAYETYTDEELYFRYLNKKPLIEFPFASPIYNLCLTLALSAAHHVIPGEHRGTGFALLSGTSTFGGAAGPIISGAIAGFNIRSIFIVNSVIYLLMIGFVHRNVRH